MSIEAEALLQEAKESIEAAQNYRSELQQRLHGLSQARKQAAVTRLLAERLSVLLSEVDVIEQDSVRPLDDCQKLIEHGVAIRCGVGEKEDKLGSFTKKALQIQLDSLPEVPVLVDVPCVSAQLDDSLLYAVRERVSRHGSVSSHPPVQIEELQERPGSVLVRWCKVDDEFAVQDYRLQYRRSVSGQYEDAYIGPEQEFLVLHLDPHTDHLFRVCARGEGRTEWSPWSVPQTGYTTLAPHEWCPGSEGYILSSRRNIAMRRAVFVNGKEMTNQLPSVTLGSAVTFDMEVVNLLPVSNNNNLSDGGNFKLRVTIGSGNREVVFDWLLDQGVDCLFFGCSLAHPGWKVLVF
ncbi:unnamed protein product [Coregonus sp. 'balchen']|nr:unnamed protein product [Coregonus sp. 'balchen']